MGHPKLSAWGLTNTPVFRHEAPPRVAWMVDTMKRRPRLKTAVPRVACLGVFHLLDWNNISYQPSDSWNGRLEPWSTFHSVNLEVKRAPGASPRRRTASNETFHRYEVTHS